MTWSLLPMSIKHTTPNTSYDRVLAGADRLQKQRKSHQNFGILFLPCCHNCVNRAWFEKIGAQRIKIKSDYMRSIILLTPPNFLKINDTQKFIYLNKYSIKSYFSDVNENSIAWLLRQFFFKASHHLCQNVCCHFCNIHSFKSQIRVKVTLF